MSYLSVCSTQSIGQVSSVPIGKRRSTVRATLNFEKGLILVVIIVRITKIWCPCVQSQQSRSNDKILKKLKKKFPDGIHAITRLMDPSMGTLVAILI